MSDFHGIIFAYSANPELRELVSVRTAASLPFCGRYRLIDFALSSLKNAGIRDVGVIMQRDYQSLLDHIRSGKAWDMSRRTGGLRILPPFGLPEFHTGNYSGTIEALNAVGAYIKDIPQNHIILMQGNLCANIDLEKAMEQHLHSGAEITAVCADHTTPGTHHRCLFGEDGAVRAMLFGQLGEGEGLPCTGCYIINKPVLLAMMEKCRGLNQHLFHRDALADFLAGGGRMEVFVHEGYIRCIRSVEDFYTANMDMLDPELRRSIFPPQRPVCTHTHEGVSTYYGEDAVSLRSLVADNCIIEGSIENCIVFSGARIGRGAKLSNCIIMRDCTVGPWSELSYVVSDKHVSFSPGCTLTGSPRLPIVVPKGSKL